MLRGAHHVEGEGFGNRRCLALAKDVVEHTMRPRLPASTRACRVCGH